MLPRIIVYSEIFPPKSGGSGRWFFELYSRLKVIKPVFLVGATPEDTPFDKTHSELHIVRYDIKRSNWGFRSLTSIKEYWRQFRILAKLIKENNAIEVHCCRILPEGVPALLAKIALGTPYTCYIHGEDIEVARTSRELTMLTKLIMRFATQLICNSKTTKGYVEKYWSAYQHKAVTLHPGVDTEYFIPAEATTTGTAGKIPTLLTVGRLQQRKGHDVVIKALAELKARGVIYQYRIAGDGEEKAALKALSDRLGVTDQVVFLAEISDQILKAEYQNCDIFILANRRVGNDDEGFGMVLLEAQACEKPVIAGRAGGTWETMIEQETGWLVDCTDKLALVALLTDQAALMQHQQLFGQAGRQYVLEHYSWPVLTAKAQTIFGWDIAECTEC